MAEQVIQLPWLKGSIHFTPATKGVGKFLCGDAFEIQMKPAKIGVNSEMAALVHRCRQHEHLALQNLWTINTESKIPMGSEPKIVREWRLAGHILSVTSDIRIGGKVTMDRLENDSMNIVSNWKKISILTQEDDVIGNWQSFERIAGDNQLIYNQSTPPLVILIEAVSGDVLEICAGEDLWRLNSKEQNEGKRLFTLETHAETISLTRVLGQWKSAESFAQRTWRSKWHLAWLPKDYKAVFPCQPRTHEKWDLIELVDVKKASKNIDNGICMMSDIAGKTLRHHVRSALAAQEKKRIKLINYQTGLCNLPQHCGRAGDKKMLHWDITEMIDIWVWANSQLVKTQSLLSVETIKDSKCAQLPSLIGLLYPNLLF